MKKILCLFLCFLICFCLFSCGNDGLSVDGALSQSGEDEEESVVITVKDYGRIVVRLYPGRAPVTVANFKKLVREGYYDGTVFHRVIEDFMIQGGNGKTTDTIKGEFSANGFENTIKHERGVISMARAKAYDSASSQFFICQTTARCKHLDGQYAAFGRVTEGMDVVDRIAAVKTDSSDQPLTPVVIESVRFL